jgi:hypothetical protein
MAMHGIAHHHAQVLDGITLSGDGMAKSSCDNAAIHLGRIQVASAIGKVGMRPGAV